MKAPADAIPVVLFAYARPVHLARALACLRENQVPLIYAYADGAKGAADAAATGEVRALLRAIDWCEVRLVERPENLGLGRNVLAGVTEVAARHEAFIVWEDDLICVPGTYAWLCAALRHYAADARVYSVTGWSHDRIRPASAGRRPYFDARAESWSWGGYARSWQGMPDETALGKLARVEAKGIDPATCGSDLPVMAEREAEQNLWAVRWLYHHLLHGGLCLRPGESLVDHAGFDRAATNTAQSTGWANARLPDRAELPDAWPEPVENPECRALWREANAGRWSRFWRGWWRRIAPRARG